MIACNVFEEVSFEFWKALWSFAVEMFIFYESMAGALGGYGRNDLPPLDEPAEEPRYLGAGCQWDLDGWLVGWLVAYFWIFAALVRGRPFWVGSLSIISPLKQSLGCWDRFPPAQAPAQAQARAPAPRSSECLGRMKSGGMSRELLRILCYCWAQFGIVSADKMSIFFFGETLPYWATSGILLPTAEISAVHGQATDLIRQSKGISSASRIKVFLLICCRSSVTERCWDAFIQLFKANFEAKRHFWDHPATDGQGCRASSLEALECSPRIWCQVTWPKKTTKTMDGGWRLGQHSLT